MNQQVIFLKLDTVTRSLPSSVQMNRKKYKGNFNADGEEGS